MHEQPDHLSDFTTDRRVLLLSLLAIAVGVFGALVARALVWLIAVITNLAYFQRFSSAPLSPSENHLGPWAVLVPVAGALVIGLMARFGSEKIRGHGIPEALEAILIGRSRIEPKVAILKPVSSAISIGTGGPFGAEGPIIMTGGAIGSLFGQGFHLSSAERKTLLVAGAAAGMSAIFASPLAAVLLAVELLLFEWKPRSFVPVSVAAIVAGALRVPLLGSGPIFPVVPHPLLSISTIGIAVAVGVVAGLASGVLTRLVYFFEDQFQKLPFHWMWWPILGGVVVGLGGLLDPRVLGVGYESIHGLLAGRIVGGSAVLLLAVKAVVWSVALGSGTSGGVLAPLLMMGGALGALEAPLLPGDAGLWAMLSMAAMMGGTMRSPLTAIVFTLELTHDVGALPGLLAAAVAAHAVTVLLLRRSILTEKIARRGHHLVREYSVDPFEIHRVSEVMDDRVPTIPASMTVAELSRRLAGGERELSRRQGTPIVDAEGRLVGIITRSDLMRALEEGGAGGDRTVLEAGSRELVVAYPDELIREAVTRMLRHEIGRLPIVSREDPARLVGYLGRAGVMAARVRLFHEEHVRERGRDPEDEPVPARPSS